MLKTHNQQINPTAEPVRAGVKVLSLSKLFGIVVTVEKVNLN